MDNGQNSCEQSWSTSDFGADIACHFHQFIYWRKIKYDIAMLGWTQCAIFYPKYWTPWFCTIKAVVFKVLSPRQIQGHFLLFWWSDLQLSNSINVCLMDRICGAQKHEAASKRTSKYCRDSSTITHYWNIKQEPGNHKIKIRLILH